MPDAVRYWKVLDAKGQSCHGGRLAWSLPTWTGRAWKPGTWLPRIDGPILCQRGYHLCRDDDLLAWLHESIWRAEIHPDAETLTSNDKVVTSGPVRLVAGTAWNDETARLFAVACAVDVLPWYEQRHPDDLRVGDALVTAWKYAHGFATLDELAAARGAAWDAASAAARGAAWDAAWQAQTARLLRYLDGEVDI